jgi:predicted ATPase
MRELSAVFLRDAERAPDSPEVLVGHRIVGITHFVDGDYIDARAHLEQALASYDAERHRLLAFRYGVDSGVSCKVYLAYTLWPLGETARARRLADEALADAQNTGHLATVAYAVGHVCELDLLWRDTERLLQHAQSLVALSREHGLQMWLAFGTFELGYARWRIGERDAGDTDIRLGMGMLREQGILVRRTLFESAHAEVEAELGHVDAALGMLDQALARVQQSGLWNLAELHRIRGEILWKRDPANLAPAEEAFLAAIAIAQQQKAKSFELRAALALAKLYQSTNRAADAHAVLAPALEGFSPTPELPEIAEAQTLLATLAETDEVKNAAALRQRRLRLQTSYGQAMLHARGYSAPETTAAFARARELTAGIENPAERFSVYFGLWAGSFVRGDLAATREITDIMLTETKERPDSPEACTAIRLDGNAHWMAGNFVMARDQLERALAMFDPERDADLVIRFAQDVGVAKMAYLALAFWPLGEVDRARKIAEEMMARAIQIGHVGSIVYGHSHVAALELMRLNLVAAGRNSETLVELARAHEIPMFAAYGAFYRSWSRVSLVDREIGLADMRAAIAACRKLGIGLNVPRFVAALAEAEAQAGEFDAALATVEGAIAEIERDGQRWCEAEAHRIRGEILGKRDRANTAPAQEAFLAAIAIAQQQKARSFELRAALALAKLYQSTNRAADAHAVLAPALDGFAPTPEFPEIAEAQTLLAALAATDEVKNAAASRQRRLKLQTSYGQAMMWSKCFGAEETKAAFTRARELAASAGNDAERFDTNYGLWVGNLLHGELALAQETAEVMLREAENAGRAIEVQAATRMLGAALHFQGDFTTAEANLTRSLRMYDPERDRDTKFRFGMDSGVVATIYRAHARWQLGEVGRGRALIEGAVARSVEAAHAPTLANTYHFKAIFEMLNGNAEAVRRVAESPLNSAGSTGSRSTWQMQQCSLVGLALDSATPRSA